MKNRFEDYITNLGNIETIQKETASNLVFLEERSQKNMKMIRSFIAEIQNFVNILERRVLHVKKTPIFSPFDDLSIQTNNLEVTESKNKKQNKTS